MKVLKEGKEIKITCVTCGAKLAITQTDIKPFLERLMLVIVAM